MRSSSVSPTASRSCTSRVPVPSPDVSTDVNWKSYNISQQGLPDGPILILVHVASTNVPFTSESKDAIASIPEIEKEIILALQDLGRDLKLFVSRRDKNKVAEDRARAVCAIIPEIAEKVSEIVEKPLVDTHPLKENSCAS